MGDYPATVRNCIQNFPRNLGFNYLSSSLCVLCALAPLREIFTKPVIRKNPRYPRSLYIQNFLPLIAVYSLFRHLFTYAFIYKQIVAITVSFYNAPCIGRFRESLFLSDIQSDFHLSSPSLARSSAICASFSATTPSHFLRSSRRA